MNVISSRPLIMVGISFVFIRQLKRILVLLVLNSLCRRVIALATHPDMLIISCALICESSAIICATTQPLIVGLVVWK